MLKKKNENIISCHEPKKKEEKKKKEKKTKKIKREKINELNFNF